MSNESLERLIELTQHLFPHGDEYGVEAHMLGVDEKLARAADLIVEAQVTLAIYGATAEEQKAAVVLSEAKTAAEAMVVEAKVAADLLLVKARKAAQAVLLLAKEASEKK